MREWTTGGKNAALEQRAKGGQTGQPARRRGGPEACPWNQKRTCMLGIQGEVGGERKTAERDMGRVVKQRNGGTQNKKRRTHRKP